MTVLHIYFYNRSYDASEELEMGSESSQIMLKKDKLEVLDILKESLLIPFKNTSFIILTSLTSLPFFCFLFVFEIFLQKTFVESPRDLRQSHDYDYGYFSSDWVPQVVPFFNTKKLSMNFLPSLIQLSFLYLVPYYVLELFITIMVVDLASKLHAEEKPVSLGEMIRKPINKTRLKGPFITSLYVLLFSTSALLGLIWIITNCCILSRITEPWYHYYYNYDDYWYDYHSWRNFLFKMLIYVSHGGAFIALLMKYMEWSAGWNMSVVISVLEEAYGGEAFEASAYFSRGSSKKQGLLLMLVFFLWGLSLRLPCLFGGCYEKIGGIMFTVVYTSLICIGHVMKWVVCVVYFFHCKKQTLEKKIDEEIGEEVKGANST